MDYFQQPESFNFMSLLSNPMILMSVFTFGLVMVMPKLQAQLDEVKKTEGGQEAPKMPELAMPDVSANLANWFMPADGKDKAKK
jgi:hypothetical protein